ncbi:hypothetical protein B9J93_05105 [Vibrio sp. V17_P4S1T151]|uniref:hypothetical protein n=1 Tax=unclassified Vibrio TaxID=2614977 RepID=UPI000B8E477C|nr:MULTISPECIES: hypothetical protein [unclassified Vibrio]OXX48266.1 hypothetical protein B9J93_05105 [Vibrio sp. V17_P4S1T151]OXX60998.1 hypothetical protein B9J89_16255 [Vibrio sp. V15_P4S5T153]
MNFFSFIRRDEFIKKLFPQGLIDDVYLGQIKLDVEGRMSINVHTKQKPEIEVKKWGKWGENYNVIVLVLNGTGCDNISIDNWASVGYSKLNIIEDHDSRYISQSGENWKLKIKFEDFIFQHCEVYID